LKPDAAKWLSGEELLESFKVPDAKRFRTVFCSKCDGQDFLGVASRLVLRRQ
jgi:hypothetical protein